MNRFAVLTDANGMSGDAYIISDSVNVKTLAANTPKTDTVPVLARFVLITSTATVYFRLWGGGTLAVPGDISDGSGPELVPTAVPALRAIVGAITTGTVAASTTALTVDSTDGITINDTIVIQGAGAAGVPLTTTVNAVNHNTKIVTLAAAATTAVSLASVVETVNSLTVVSPTTAVVTLAYYR